MSLKEVIADTDAAEKNLSQMDAVLKSTGDASGMTKTQLVELAEAQSKVTTYSTETTEKAENMLLTFTKIGSDVFPETVKATEDMATAMHMDATQAAQQLGKALNDPATGYTKLQRIGVTFTASQVQTIKAMEKAGNTAGAQKIILQELEKEYGSSAKAAGSTLTGQIQIMQNNVKSAGVQIMGAVLPIVQNILPSFVKGIQGLAVQVMAHKSEIVAAFTAVGNGIKTVFGWVESHGQLVKNLVIGIASAVGVWKAAMLTANVVQAVNNALTVTAAISTGGLKAGEEALAAAKGSTTLATMALSAATIKDTAVKIAHAVATKASTAAQTLFNAALSANPIGIVITLIAALVAALVVLFNKNKAFHDWVINAWNTIKSLAGTVGNGIKNVFTGAWSGIVSGANAAKANTISAFNGLKSGLTTAMNAIKTALTTAWNGIVSVVKAIIQPFINGILDFWRNMQTGISNITGGINNMLSGAWKVVSNELLGGILLFIDTLKGIFTGNWTQFNSDLQHVRDNIRAGTQQFLSGITQFFTGFVQTVISIFQTAWTHLTENITLAWNGIKAVTTTVWNAIVAFFSTTWVNIGNGIKSAWTGFWTTIGNLCNTIKTGIINIWNSVISWFRNLPGTLLTIGANMFTSMQTGINSTISNVVNAVKTGIGAAIDWIKALPGEAVQWGEDIINGIVNGIKSAASAVGDAVKGVAQDIRKFLHFSVPDEGPLVDFPNWMPDMMAGFAQGIEANKYKVVSAMHSLAADMSIAPTVRPAYAGTYAAPRVPTVAESVQTAVKGGNITIQNVYYTKTPSASEISRQQKDELRRLALGF
jgi:phage-related protein